MPKAKKDDPDVYQTSSKASLCHGIRLHQVTEVLGHFYFYTDLLIVMTQWQRMYWKCSNPTLILLHNKGVQKERDKFND